MDLTIPIVDSFATAIRERRPYPKAASVETLQAALALLPAVVEKSCGSGPIGLKAGLTDSRQQSQFGLDQPLLGCLYANSRLLPDARLHLEPHVYIECEVGVQVNREGQVIAVVPAIEIVRLEFASPATLTAVDLVMANLGAYKFMTGAVSPWQSLDWNALQRQTLVLTQNGEVKVSMPLAGALNQARQTGEWVAQEAVRRGVDIPESGLILTGTCGVPVPADVGTYRASFGSLGRLEFEVIR